MAAWYMCALMKDLIVSVILLYKEWLMVCFRFLSLIRGQPTSFTEEFASVQAWAFDAILTSFRRRLDFILAPSWLHFGVDLTSFWRRVLTSFWRRPDFILTSSWLHFDVVLTSFLTSSWLHFDFILTSSWLHFDFVLTRCHPKRHRSVRRVIWHRRMRTMLLRQLWVGIVDVICRIPSVTLCLWISIIRFRISCIWRIRKRTWLRRQTASSAASSTRCTSMTSPVRRMTTYQVYRKWGGSTNNQWRKWCSRWKWRYINTWVWLLVVYRLLDMNSSVWFCVFAGVFAGGLFQREGRMRESG